MAWKQFETLHRFGAKPSLVVNCCVKQTHAVLLLGFSLHIRQMSNIPRTPPFFYTNNSNRTSQGKELLYCTYMKMFWIGRFEYSYIIWRQP